MGLRNVLRCLPALLWAGAAPASGASSPDVSVAIELYRAGNYEGARSELEKLRAHGSESAEIAFHLGEIERVQKRWAEAIRHYEDAVRLNPTEAAYWTELGKAYGAQADQESSLSDAEKSRSALEKAVSLDPANYESRAALAQFYRLAPGFAGGGLS